MIYKNLGIMVFRESILSSRRTDSL